MESTARQGDGDRLGGGAQERALSRRGDGKSDVVNEQCGRRNEL